MNTEIVWAAGLFEGEGYLTRAKAGNRVYLHLGLQTTDLDVLKRFVRAMRSVGCTKSARRSGPKTEAGIARRKRRASHHKEAWSWGTSGDSAVTGYKALRPYLGDRRREVGDQIVQEMKLTRAQSLAMRPCEKCGTWYQPNDYGQGRRFCTKSCWYEWHSQQPGYKQAQAARSRKHKLKMKSPALIPGQLRLDR